MGQSVDSLATIPIISASTCVQSRISPNCTRTFSEFNCTRVAVRIGEMTAVISGAVEIGVKSKESIGQPV